jgi:hypothetical protein
MYLGVDYRGLWLEIEWQEFFSVYTDYIMIKRTITNNKRILILQTPIFTMKRLGNASVGSFFGVLFLQIVNGQYRNVMSTACKAC